MARLTDRELDLIQSHRHPSPGSWNDPIDLLLIARRMRGSYLAKITGLASLTEALSVRVLQPIHSAMCRRRTVRELSRLDDRMLRDIGLERSQIEDFAGQLAGTQSAAAARPNPLLARFRKWRHNRATVRELEALDDRLLQDIGLVRGDIRPAVYGESAKPAAPSGASAKAARLPGARLAEMAGQSWLGRAIGRSWTALVLWYRRERTISELQTLDDWILEDLGLVRGQIPEVAAQLAAPKQPAAKAKPAAAPLDSVILTMRRWNLSRLAASQMARLGPDTLTDLGYVKGDIDWVPEVLAERSLRAGSRPIRGKGKIRPKV